MKGRRVLPGRQKNSCHARSIPGRLRCCQPPIQKFAKYRAIFVSIQMLAKYCGPIFGRLWFWIFTLPSALLVLGTDFEVFVALAPSVIPSHQFNQSSGSWHNPILKSIISSKNNSKHPYKSVFFLMLAVRRPFTNWPWPMTNGHSFQTIFTLYGQSFICSGGNWVKADAKVRGYPEHDREGLFVQYYYSLI